MSNPGAAGGPAEITPAHDTLFTSGALGRYSTILNSVAENRKTPADREVMAD